MVALELAKAYNGMLVEGGHTVDLASPDLPMKLLTECTVLRPALLPVDEAQDQSWAAQVPQGGTVKYPDVLLGGARMPRRELGRWCDCGCIGSYVG